MFKRQLETWGRVGVKIRGNNRHSVWQENKDKSPGHWRGLLSRPAGSLTRGTPCLGPLSPVTPPASVFSIAYTISSNRTRHTITTYTPTTSLWTLLIFLLGFLFSYTLFL